MMFVEIEGPLDSLKGLSRIEGVQSTRSLHDLGGGRYRTSAYLTSRSALTALEARGLTVRVTMDEDEVNRRVSADHEMMKHADADSGTSTDGGGSKPNEGHDNGGTPGPRKQ